MALTAIWPAVDEYTAKSELLAQSVAERQKAWAEVAGLPDLEARLTVGQAELAQWEGRTVGEGTLHLFRGKVVELARSHNCQLRQIRVGQARQRPWRPGDDPLDPNPPSDPGRTSSFALKTQELTLSVSGSLPNIKAFASGLTAMGHLAHNRSLSIAASGGGDKEVVLELGLMLFDLQQTTAPAPAAAGPPAPGAPARPTEGAA